MKRITRKSVVRLIVAQCIEIYKASGLTALIKQVDLDLLDHAVKFPLLEFVADEISGEIKSAEYLKLASGISDLQKEGGNVLIGILMRNYLPINLNKALEKTCNYIDQGKVWYCSDLIGERVFGNALLQFPAEALLFYRQKSTINSTWVRRALGAGGHFAIKRGLDQETVEQLFLILIKMAVPTNKEKEIKQGIGWAAKTTAKFHPPIIEKYKSEIANEDRVANWFRKKVEIGLQRHNYAKGDRGKIHIE